MASLQKKGEGWYCQVLHRGKRHTFTLGRVSKVEADAKAAQVDYLLMRLKQRLIELPPGVGIVEFLLHDGRSPATARTDAPGPAESLTLAALRDLYLTTRGEALEARTLDTARLHFKHLCDLLGDGYPISGLTLPDLQSYVDRRGRQKTRDGKRISPTTVRKEVVTLRTAWNWGAKMRLVASRYPNDGLSYPKIDEKPPFQTKAEVERSIAAGGLTPAQVMELWESLYLQAHELAGFLAHIRDHATYPWIYPLVCMAAHTGARRSELLRMQVTDLDAEGGSVLIREKKRVKGKRSTRRAPLSPTLAVALEEWKKVHPGGNALFCHSGEVSHSKKRSALTGWLSGAARAEAGKERMKSVKAREAPPTLGPLTASEVHDHFRRTLRKGEWKVVRGLHVLRHSMISCMAAAGVDQRIIDDIVGHTSPEMQRRYRHLPPQLKSQAVASVFG